MQTIQNHMTNSNHYVKTQANNTIFKPNQKQLKTYQHHLKQFECNI